MIEHPFISGLDEKSLEELQNTISDLTKKLNFSYRMGNQALIHQLTMAIESYRSAYSKKISEMVDKQKINSKINVQSDK